MRRAHESLATALTLCLVAGTGLVLPPTRASAVCVQPALFGPAARQTVGTRTNRVELADLNEDGILDLVACQSETSGGGLNHTVAVMLGGGSGGTGDGTFGPPQLYTVGPHPVGIALADFDADGHLDLVVTTMGDNNVSFLHGLGDGTFAAPVTSGAGPGPYEVVAGDFNHDGILDLAVANNTVKAFSVLIGLGSGGIGNGHFATPVTYPLSGLSVGIAAGDLNHDGHLDLVATENFAGVAVMFGQGTGSFGTAQYYAAGEQPYDVTLRDLDGDGNLDLAAGNSSYGGVTVLKGSATGAFGTPAAYAAGLANVGGVVAADFNGDAITDLAFTDATGDNVVVLKGGGAGGVGNGTFTVHSSYLVSAFPLGLATGDLDGDGAQDLVVSGWSDAAEISILLASCEVPGPDPRVPHLVSVRDVPNDQGGRVFLRWTRSSYDTAGTTRITGYRVWRRLPPEAAAAALARTASAGAAPLRAVPVRTGSALAGIEYWEAIATLPAERLAGYGYTASTTQDSLPGSNPFTAFFVTALTSDAAVFYESNVDSGYSVDNLAPPLPSPFTATYLGTSTALHWGASPTADLLEFRLYRGSSAGFVPGSGNLLAATRDTSFVDVPGAFHYKLEAVDVHGNRSRIAAVSPATPVATLASLVAVDASSGRVELAWYSAAGGSLDATVYRRTEGSGWESLADVSADGSGYLRYVDEAVQAGTRYGYCLGVTDAGTLVFVGEAWVEVGALDLALAGVRPNPSPRGRLSVDLVLPSAAPAQLELFDVGGRRLARREVGSLGVGRHAVDLSQGLRIPAGRYVIRLSQGGRVRTAGAVVLD
jgi:hypothetical protein